MITGRRVPGGGSWVRNQAVYSAEKGARDRRYFDDNGYKEETVGGLLELSHL